MVKSIICLNNTKISNIRCDTIPKQLDDETLDLESEYIYDVDNFTQFTSSIDNINTSLNKKANENEKGVSFEFICKLIKKRKSEDNFISLPLKNKISRSK